MSLSTALYLVSPDGSFFVVLVQAYALVELLQCLLRMRKQGIFDE
jgi:hypothetical protein